MFLVHLFFQDVRSNLFRILNLALFVAIFNKNDSINVLNKHVKLHQTG